MEAVGINVGYLVIQCVLFGLPVFLLAGAAIYLLRRNESNKTDS